MVPYCISIAARTPSLNETLRLHWAQRKRMKEQWAWFLKANVDKEVDKNKPYFNVKIISRRKKLLDYDNLVGACKEIIVDNLRDIGLIKNDDPESVKIEYVQEKGPDETQIILGDNHDD